MTSRYWVEARRDEADITFCLALIGNSLKKARVL